MNNRLIFFIPILLFAIALQIYWGNIFDFRMNFALAALIAAAFFLDFIEFLFAPILTVFILNWQPIVSPEILIFAVLPFIVFPFRRLHLRPWLMNLAVSPLIFTTFYLTLGPQFLLAHPVIFLKDFLGGTIFGSLAIQILDRAA